MLTFSHNVGLLHINLDQLHRGLISITSEPRLPDESTIRHNKNCVISLCGKTGLYIRSLTQQRLNCGEKRQPEKLSTGSLQGTLWTLCRQFPSQCQLVDQLTALSAYLKHYLLNYWNCLCCVFVRKWCALCISKDPSTQKRCCVQPICWPIYPSQKGILFLVTQNINLRNKTTELAHPIHNQKNQNLDQWYLATKQRMSGLSTLG